MSDICPHVALNGAEWPYYSDESVADRISSRFPTIPSATIRAIVADVVAELKAGAGASPAAWKRPAEVDQPSELGLRQGLANLAQLAMGHRGLPDMLTNIAAFAVQAIPGADGAGLTLFQNERQNTIVATAAFVQDVDIVQYELGEGPCITAASEGIPVRSGSLSTDVAFPRFGPEANQLGVHSALSLPLIHNGVLLGTMNVYAHRRDVFDDRAVELGEMYALPAAISVLNAQTLAQAQRLASQLQQALDNATDEVTSVIDILLRHDKGSLSD